MTKETIVKVKMGFEGGSYFASLEAALCAVMAQETCGMCGKAIGDPQNAVKVLEVITIDGNEGLPVVGHSHFARRVYGPAQSFPVGLEIANQLSGQARRKMHLPRMPRCPQGGHQVVLKNRKEAL